MMLLQTNYVHEDAVTVTFDSGKLCRLPYFSPRLPLARALAKAVHLAAKTFKGQELFVSIFERDGDRAVLVTEKPVQVTGGKDLRQFPTITKEWPLPN